MSSTRSIQETPIPSIFHHQVLRGDSVAFVTPQVPCSVDTPAKLHPKPRTTPTVATTVEDNNALSGRPDWQWGMPSLSSYTPFESLLFFQFLSTLESRPSNFSPISELLTNNSFVRQNATFDKDRLTPQALEALYTKLVQEELQNREGTQSGHGSNGYNSDAANSNPKKRKIQDQSSKLVLDGASYSVVIPTLVARLYARYKERVTREIEDEEHKYARIKEEIKRLEDGEQLQNTFSKIDDPLTTSEIDKKSPQTKPLSPQPVTVSPSVNVVRGQGTALEEVQALQTPENPPPVLAKGQAAVQQAPQAEGKNANASHPSPLHSQSQQWHESGPHAILQSIPVLSPAPSLGNVTASITPSQDQISDRGLQYVTSKAGQSGVKTPTIPHVGTGRVAGQVFTSTTPAASQASQPPLQPMPTATSGPQQQRTSFQPAQYSPPQAQMTLAPPSANYQQPWSPQLSPSSRHTQLSPNTNMPSSNSHLMGKSPLSLGHVQLNVGKTLQNPSTPSHQPSRAGELESPQQIENDARVKATSMEPLPATPVSGPDGLNSVTPSFSAALNKRPPRLSVDSSGSLTPWKMPSPIVISKSPGSPLRPRPEDVSPISERAPSPTFESETPSISKIHSEPRAVHVDVDSGPAWNTRQKKSTPARRGRAHPSAGSSPIRVTRIRSRSAQSNVSRDDESITDSGSVSQRKIKREIPSTPAGISDDTEMEPRTSRRLKVPSQIQADEIQSKGRGKRKRGPSEGEDMTQPPSRQASQYVQFTRNFPRTCAPIMNDVASHKYASIFAKPLTERDAPGYKNLIYRPQDIKSIKSAIHQGSKAVAAATEAVNTPSGENVESPGPLQGHGTPSRTNGLLLKRTAELIPPKGIVNSAQLEMELVRMFANAVMFNPTPDKTFGSSFPMQSNWTSREGSQVSDMDEGGIINDTLKMYDDVEKAVSRWRAAERAVDDVGGKSMLSLRRGSASDINMDSADEVK
ncbi:hypothetical protein I7I51_03457 [Histoplasma capsulatum]|uniref:Bromo domain-containing protein n=1 Tax=Ajellomyces capsulatus TaxID=5037 RepID=A0A8A1M9I6_AJECA|nr:hypothetical protein I7I51_03457 [Histoplasma capsulatum]